MKKLIAATAALTLIVSRLSSCANTVNTGTDSTTDAPPSVAATTEGSTSDATENVNAAPEETTDGIAVNAEANNTTAEQTTADTEMQSSEFFG